MSEPQTADTSLRTHLRTWGLLWAAVGIGLLLVGSTAWVHRGLSAHTHELAEVHGAFLLSHHRPVGTLEEQLHTLRRYGAWNLTLLDAEGRAVESVGWDSDGSGRAPAGPVATAHGRYRIEHPTPRGTLVVEYVPLLAVDLLSRARRGVLVALFASVLLVVVVTLWIRHRLALEALTLEAERTRQLAQLGTLSAVIAHELRNPLTVLMGHVQLLAEDLPDSRSLRHVEKGANRLTDLLDSLLDFARVGEVAPERVDPMALLRQVADETGLQTDATSGAAPEWDLDPSRMHQVLLNLVTNALSESSDGVVELSARVDDEHLVLEVRDHGGGIPEGMHESIFEPFHTTRTRGTGLGLAVARSIVEKHRGTLTAHDAPGGGALFRIRVPS